MSEALRKRENTRARLIESAVQVFLAKGFAGAKIDDIVKGAGFTRGAFYSNFSSLDELLHEVAVHEASELITTIRASIDAAGADITVEDFLTMFDAVRPRGRSMYILTTELTLHLLREPEADRALASEFDGLNAEVTSIVEQVVASMGCVPTLPIPVLSQIVITGFLNTFAQAELHGIDQKALEETYVRGILETFTAAR